MEAEIEMKRVHNVSVSYCDGDVSLQSYDESHFLAAASHYYRRIGNAIEEKNMASPGHLPRHITMVTLIVADPDTMVGDDGVEYYVRKPKFHCNSGFFDCLAGCHDG